MKFRLAPNSTLPDLDEVALRELLREAPEAPLDLAGAITPRPIPSTPAETVERREMSEAPGSAGASQKPRRARGEISQHPQPTARRRRRASAEKEALR